MLQALKKFFGGMPSWNAAEMVRNGAQIVDVRTPEEFRSGNIPGSINIPVRELEGRIKKLKKGKPVITCCASGVRSGVAKTILEQYGFSEVYNGGGWISLRSRLQK